MAKEGISATQAVLIMVALFVLVGGTYYIATGGLKSVATPTQVPVPTPTSVPNSTSATSATGLGAANLPVFVADNNDPNHAALSGVPVFYLVNGIPFGTVSTVNGSATVASLAKGTTVTIYVGNDVTTYLKSYSVPITLGAQETTMAPLNVFADQIGTFGTLSAVANGGQINVSTVASSHFELALNISNTANNKKLDNVKLYMQALTPQNANPFTASPFLRWDTAAPSGVTITGTDMISGYTFSELSVAKGAAKPTMVADINPSILINNTKYLVCVDDMSGATIAAFPGTTGTGATPACFTLQITN